MPRHEIDRALLEMNSLYIMPPSSLQPGQSSSVRNPCSTKPDALRSSEHIPRASELLSFRMRRIYGIWSSDRRLCGSSRLLVSASEYPFFI
jgi:hypothetical protein